MEALLAELGVAEEKNAEGEKKKKKKKAKKEEPAEEKEVPKA